MYTVRIKTIGTKKFSRHSTGGRGFSEATDTSLHAAIVAAITDFHDYVRNEGAHTGIHACLVTWEDGEDLYAFIFPKDSEIPSNPVWILMRSQPEHVLRHRG